MSSSQKDYNKNELGPENKKIEDFIRNQISCEVSGIKNFIHYEINTLHLDIIKQFEIQQVYLSIKIARLSKNVKGFYICKRENAKRNKRAEGGK
jgi:hypothetical protein